MRPFNPNAYGNPKRQSRPTGTSIPQPSKLFDQNVDVKPESEDTHQATDAPLAQSSAHEDNEKGTLTAWIGPENVSRNQASKLHTVEGVDPQVQPNRQLAATNGVSTALTTTPNQTQWLENAQKQNKLPQESCSSMTNGRKEAASKDSTEKDTHREEIHQESLPAPGISAPESLHPSKVTFEFQANDKSAHPSKPSKSRPNSTSEMPHSNVGAPRSQPIIPLDLQNGEQMSPEAMLNRARDKAVRDIKLRIRAKDKNSTTALGVLDLARKPIPKQKSHVDNQTAAPPVENNWSAFGHTQSTPDLTGTNNNTYKTHPVSSSPSRPQTADGDVGKSSEAVHVLESLDQLQDAELKAIPADLGSGSNDWGASIPSDASQTSNDSVRPLHVGKLLDKHHPEALPPHVRWNPGWQPPPVDWHERTRFDNDTKAFRDNLENWKDEVIARSTGNGDLVTQPIPTHVLEDTRLVPDGIFLVFRDYTLNPQNAHFYGYVDSRDVAKYAQSVKETDFQDWGKLDLNRAENAAIKEETTEKLVSNWIQHTEGRRKNAAIQTQHDQQALESLNHYESAPNPNQPLIDIYLRPAVDSDIPQMADIYNWYVKNSCRTAERVPVKEKDIEGRFDESISCKLPLLVAVKTHHPSRPHDSSLGGRSKKDRSSRTNKVGVTAGAAIGRETIVGWASAQDITAFDFVEHISVELEVFVEPAHRQMGIGRCLLDQLLEACDRGYLKRGGYPFQCEQEVRHLYTSGGGRNLHKLMFLVRKWKFPKVEQDRKTKRPRSEDAGQKKSEDREDDYDIWLKAWLESWGFWVEGVLSGMGAKNGRFIDVAYFTKETSWAPAEGHIPDPLPKLSTLDD